MSLALSQGRGRSLSLVNIFFLDENEMLCSYYEIILSRKKMLTIGSILFGVNEEVFGDG